MKRIISLITDFGLKDNFVGVMKAVILKINPQALIVDITHQINPQDILAGAFLLKNSYSYFPSGTIHLVVVDPGVGSTRKKILVETKNYYFIAPDNGILSWVLKEQKPQKIFEITNVKYFLQPISNTFHGRDIFAPVAAYLSKGINPERFGRRIKSLKNLELPSVKITPKQLIGECIYIDHFGNLISNIEKDIFFSFIKNKNFKIFIKNKIIKKLSNSYTEGTPLRPVALFNSFGLLEIALKDASLKKYLGIKKGEKIKVSLCQN